MRPNVDANSLKGTAMKLLQRASFAVTLSFAAFAVNAQMPDQPASSSPGNGSQDTPQQLQLPQHQLQLPQPQPAPPGSDQTTDELSAPSVPQRQQKAPSQTQQESAPSLPGTANENKADPTSQNNPK
jgi:hypothetical protein